MRGPARFLAAAGWMNGWVGTRIALAPGWRGVHEMCDFFKKLPCWLTVGALVLLVVFLLNWPSGSAEWAAWVQALGTIAAVASGFALHFWRRRELELHRLLQIERALRAVKIELDRSIDEADENGDVGIDFPRLSRIMAFLDRKIDQADLEFEVVSTVADLIHVVRERDRGLNQAKASGEVRPLVSAVYDALDMDGSLKKRIDEALTSVRRRREAIKKAAVFGVVT